MLGKPFTARPAARAEIGTPRLSAAGKTRPHPRQIQNPRECAERDGGQDCNHFAAKRPFERPLPTRVARSENEVVGSKLGSRGRRWRALHSNSVGFFLCRRSQRWKPPWGQNPKVNTRWKHRDYHLRSDLEPRATSSSPLPLQPQDPTSSLAPSVGTRNQ